MDWLSTARDCYEASTTYVDTNYRKKWEYSLRAFQNEHAPGSKYLSDEYKGRSKLFRPKTRSVIRKGEAACFMTIGNLDDLNIEAEDPDNVYASASAEAMKAIFRYRLSKTINWPILVAGAYQDAATVGVVCSYNYWDYEQREGKNGQRTVLKDQPCIKLVPVENLRIDPAADWMDPVNSSPYFIEIIPMYVGDVIGMMNRNDPKTGAPAWKKYDDEIIARGAPDFLDTTRQVRQGKSTTDPYQEKRALKAHDIVWVLKFFLKNDGEDYCFYTLGTDALLTEPKPVREVYFHGKRPYTMGCVVIETHKAVPDGPTWMSRDLQREMNDNVNSRNDNVKLVLNKRYIVGRGRQVDIQSLLRNVPGGVTLSTDPKTDIVPLEWGDVTQSAYLEQDKLGQDFDDLVGNFTPNTRLANAGMNETLGGAKMAAGGASAMTEYQIQTLVKTWVEPTLRQLMLLEQYYETNETILALAGREMARAFPTFSGAGTDTLLMQELVLSVDFGMGSTNPETRLQKFLMATQAANQIVQTAPPGANVEEMIKEVYRNAGYRNGARFFPQGQGDPRLAKAFEMIQQLQAQLQDKQAELMLNAQLEREKLAVQKQMKDDETRVNAARIDLDADIRNKEVAVKDKAVEVDLMAELLKAEQTTKEQAIKQQQLIVTAAEADQRSESERMRITNEKERADREVSLKERETQVKEVDENRIVQIEQSIGQVVQDVVGQVETLKRGLQEALNAAKRVGEMEEALMEMAKGVGAMAMSVSEVKNRPKPTGFKKELRDGKKVIAIQFDNGDSHEMTEQ